MLRILRFSRRISEDRRARFLLLAAAVAAVALLLVSLPSGGGRATTADGAGPGGAQTLMFGDANCDGALDSLDALYLLLAIANLTVPQQDPCPEIMSGVLINGNPAVWGDQNCKDGNDSIDALILLLLVANLPRPASAPGCPELGDEVAVIHGTATPSPSPTPTETGAPTPTGTPAGDIKVLSFAPLQTPPYQYAINFVPRAISFGEAKHNNGPDPLTAEVYWGIQLQPTATEVKFRWAAEAGDLCFVGLTPTPCGEGDVAGQPSLAGETCFDGINNDGDGTTDFADPDCHANTGFIDRLEFFLDLDVSVAVSDLRRDLSVQCNTAGPFTLIIINQEEPAPPAADPDMSNNDQQTEIDADCGP